MNLELRPATPEDRSFVERVFFKTQRWLIEELFGWGGDDYERAKFAESYLPERTSIVLLDGTPIGWITLVEDADGMEIDSIYIDAPMQRRGIGTVLIRRVIDDAVSSNRALRISTAKINPARELYERLGFAVVGESRYKVFMEYSSPPAKAPRSAGQTEPPTE